MANHESFRNIIERWNIERKNLLDLSLRNALLNYRPTKRRGIQVVDESSREIFKLLVTENKAMYFAPALEQILLDANLNARDTRRSKDPLTDSWLQTPLPEKVLQAKLLATYHDARTYIEERGNNILFLSLGMIKWYEDETSDKEHFAPILLVPVSLSRTTIREKFVLRYNDDEIEENVSLSEKLKNDFGIKYPQFPGADDIDVDGYMSAIGKAINRQKRWAVAADYIVLGFFSFGKFLMYRDLDNAAWSKERQPTDHFLIRALLQDGFKDEKPALDENDYLDQHCAPDDSFQVVDADSSQLLAILDVKAGKNIVIQGPPGTGKSQTITNLIAEAIGQKKRVLFVAEKMAALEVVKRRLDQKGLGDACLELHSSYAKKTTLLDELKRTFNLGKPQSENSTAGYSYYTHVRDKLNDYSAALNTPIGTTGYTPFTLIGEMVALRRQLESVQFPPIPVDQNSIDVSCIWNRSDIERWVSIIKGLEGLLAIMGVPNEHPFRGCQFHAIMPNDRVRIKAALASSMEAFETFLGKTRQFAAYEGMETAANLAHLDIQFRIAEMAINAPDIAGVNLDINTWNTNRLSINAAVSAGLAFADIHAKYNGVLRPDAWAHDLTETRQVLGAYQTKWWRWFHSQYRVARQHMKSIFQDRATKHVTDILAVADAIVEANKLNTVIIDNSSLGSLVYGHKWRGVDSAWIALQHIAAWIAELHGKIAAEYVPNSIISFLAGNPPLDEVKLSADQTRETYRILRVSLATLYDLLEYQVDYRGGFDNAEFVEQSARLNNMAHDVARANDMAAYNRYIHSLKEANIGWIEEYSFCWPGAVTQLANLFLYNWFESVLRRTFGERPILVNLLGSEHDELVRRFRNKDQTLLGLNQLRLASLHWEQMPRYSEEGQLGILRREFEKRRHNLPIRRLIMSAKNAIQALKPIFMMSPISIASFLPPDSVDFDLVIFDEASQVKPVDAYGALLRAKQVVVVGDSKQLPPTTFFDKMVDDWEEEGEEEQSGSADMESILGLMNSKGAQTRPLLWHYRSKHESLIAVSNKEFYENRLLIFPSPNKASGNIGIVYHNNPNSIYDRGKSKTNQIEAKEIARAIMDHAHKTPDLTLGVAALNIEQMQAIIDQLEILRRDDASCEEYFASHPYEPFFIKNLESVQGDQRDVILISIGFGRSGEGNYISMNFGPLNKSGGERRLNVLITRARQRCEVFSNLSYRDIDLTRTQSRGIPALKTYLQYAETGILDTPYLSERDAGSPFEEAVAQQLKSLGYEVHRQIGSAGFFIDLAIIDPALPGKYVIGLECDGATYHSARTARDRDRLRQEVLENLGWRIYRIWSTDWFTDPERELKKTVLAIEDAKAAQGVPPKSCSDNPLKKDLPIRRNRPVARKHKYGNSDYVIADLGRINTKGMPLYALNPESLADLATQVVSVESPVHVEDVVQRIVDAAGIRRIGNRIQEAIEGGIRLAEKNGEIVRRKDFLWYYRITSPHVRDRSALAASARKMERIAPEEIEHAIIISVKNSYGMDFHHVASATCHLLGFSHLTDAIRIHIERLLNRLIKNEYLILSDGQVLPK